MTRATPQMRELASRLIAHETNGEPAGALDPPNAFRVCEKLRPQLATLMGKAGFRAVLARALVVTSADMPLLAAVQVQEDGSLTGWKTAEAPDEPQDRTEGGVLLVAQLLGLLVAFIGDNLTLRLVCEVWPKLPLDDWKFTPEDPS